MMKKTMMVAKRWQWHWWRQGWCRCHWQGGQLVNRPVLTNDRIRNGDACAECNWLQHLGLTVCRSVFIHIYVCTSARKWLVQSHNLRLIISITCVYKCSLASACVCMCIFLCIFVFLSEPQCTGKSVMTRLEGQHAIRLIALLPTRVEPSAKCFPSCE